MAKKATKPTMMHNKNEVGTMHNNHGVEMMGKMTAGRPKKGSIKKGGK